MKWKSLFTGFTFGCLSFTILSVIAADGWSAWSSWTDYNSAIHYNSSTRKFESKPQYIYQVWGTYENGVETDGWITTTCKDHNCCQNSRPTNIINGGYSGCWISSWEESGGTKYRCVCSRPKYTDGWGYGSSYGGSSSWSDSYPSGANVTNTKTVARYATLIDGTGPYRSSCWLENRTWEYFDVVCNGVGDTYSSVKHLSYKVTRPDGTTTTVTQASAESSGKYRYRFNIANLGWQNGTYKVAVTATDSSGNVSSWTDNFSQPMGGFYLDASSALYQENGTSRFKWNGSHYITNTSGYTSSNSYFKFYKWTNNSWSHVKSVADHTSGTSFSQNINLDDLESGSYYFQHCTTIASITEECTTIRGGNQDSGWITTGNGRSGRIARLYVNNGIVNLDIANESALVQNYGVAWDEISLNLAFPNTIGVNTDVVNRYDNNYISNRQLSVFNLSNNSLVTTNSSPSLWGGWGATFSLSKDTLSNLSLGSYYFQVSTALTSNSSATKSVGTANAPYALSSGTLNGTFYIKAKRYSLGQSGSNLILKVEQASPPTPYINLSTSNWTNGNVTATIGGTVNEAGLGVKKVEYKLSGATSLDWTVISNGNSITIQNHGQTTISVRVTDTSNQIWEGSSKVAKIDKYSPTVTFDGITSQWLDLAGTSKKITVNVSDNASGLQRATYTVKNGGTTLVNNVGFNPSASYTFSCSHQGVNTFSVYALDNVNNSTNPSQSLRVDCTNPVTSLSATTTQWTNLNSVTIWLYAQDAHSGLQSSQYMIEGATTQGWANFSNGQTLSISNEGQTTIRTSIKDNVNRIHSASITVKLDRVKPNAQIVTNESWQNATQQTATLYASDERSGLASMTYELSGATTTSSPQSFTNGQVITIQNEGETTIKIRVVDQAGNVQTDTKVVRLDRHNPVGSITTNEEWTNAASVPVTLKGTDSISPFKQIQYKLDGATSKPLTTYSDNTQFNIVNAGETQITIYLVDSAGNSYTETKTVRIDRTRPTIETQLLYTQLAVQPIPIEFQAADSGGSLYRYTVLPNGNYSFSEYDVYSVQANGNFTFTAWDHAGNSTSSTITVRNYGGQLNNQSPLSIDSNTVGIQPTTIDKISNTQQSLNFSQEGVSVIQGIARDEAGNVSDNTTSTVIIDDQTTLNQDNTIVKVDNSPPILTLEADTTTCTRQPIPITASLTDVYSGPKSITVENQTYAQSSLIFNATQNKVYTFSGVDYVDWTTQQSLNISNLDTIAPSIVIGSVTNGNEVTITVTDNKCGVRLVRYKLSGSTTQDWVEISPNTTIKIPNNGSTTITVEAYDRAKPLPGNQSTVSKTVTINTNKPTVQILGNDTCTNQDVLVNLKASSSSTPTELYYTQNGGNKTNFSIPGTSFTLKNAGDTTIFASIKDTSGQDSITKTFKIDKTNPTGTITTVTNGQSFSTWLNTLSVKVRLTGTDDGCGISERKYQLTGATISGGWKDYANGTEVTITNEGKTTISIYLKDVAGNEFLLSKEVWIDRGTPTIHLNTDNLYCSIPTYINISLTNTLSTSSGRYRLNNGAWVSFTDTVSIPIQTSGQYQLDVEATNGAGKTTSVSKTFVVDKENPNATITTNTGGSLWTNQVPTIVKFEHSDRLTHIQDAKYQLSGETTKTWTSLLNTNGEIRITTPGSTTIEYYATDACLNTKKPNPITVNIDTIAPKVWITPETSQWVNANKVSVTLNATDEGGSGLSTMKYQVNGGSEHDFVDGFVFDITEEGEHYIDAYVVDGAGNKTIAARAWVRIDRTPPTIDSSILDSSIWACQNTLVTLFASDNLTPTEDIKIQYRIGGTHTTDWIDYKQPFSISSQYNGITRITVRAFDYVPNESINKTYYVYNDCINPYITSFKINISNIDNRQ